MDNEALIDEMIRDAGAAAEPGELRRLQVLSKGDDETPVPMMASELKSAGWVYIYDTLTNERSVCNRNMLTQHLKKTRKDGTFVFTTKVPTDPPKRGSLKCLLHPDGINRDHYDDLGLPTCPKANLTSPFQVTRHMQKRHKQEYATIEAEKAEMEKQEQRDFQRAMMSGLKPPAPEVYESKADKAKRLAK